jgi:hypothetical protein
MLLGGAAAARPLMAGAQQVPSVPRVRLKQIKLTERQVQNFIAVEKAMAAVVEKMYSNVHQPDSKVLAESEIMAKKSGFKDFAEYDEVAANILMVFAGIDPQTKQYTDPQTAMKKKIAEIAADKRLSKRGKRELLNEYEKRLKAAQPIQYPGNIELVRKYYDKIRIRQDTRG